jgi:CheY-like chemotaxis protein
MPEGGKIIIGTRNAWLNASEATRHGVGEGNYVAITVSDTGTGMPAEVASRAFEPFFTTKPIGAGTGLGLSMIYGFTRQSGGDVTIDSTMGAGSKIEMLLPRDENASVPIEKGEASQPFSGLGRRCNILVVDDEEAVCSLVSEVVSELGCRPVQARDAREALQHLESGESFGVMITDIGLPGEMNGRKLADFAQNCRPNLEILFITGYAEATVTDDLPARSAIITKPFTIGALAAKIEEMIG